MKKLIIILLFIISITSLLAQNPQYLISQGGSVSICGADFFDNGGGYLNYGANRNDIITFISSSSVNTHQEIYFIVFDIHPSDTLYIYDGLNIAAPLIGKYNNSNAIAPFRVKATVYNTSGGLTFRFKSSASYQASGWFAALTCIPQCQNVMASLNADQCHPAPHLENGIWYFDVCQGDNVNFVADADSAAFDQNDINYHQDSANSLFIWDFGDGIIDTANNTYHTFPARIQGYDVSLLVKDVRGCYSLNSVNVRVRVAGNPLRQISNLPGICAGDSLILSFGFDSASTVNVGHVGAHQGLIQGFDSTMIIPDGPNCPPGYCNAYVSFNNFAPGQVMQTANDLMSICVSMEHSFFGDLGFRIICPNGQSVILDSNNQLGGGVSLGVPYGGANHGAYDNGCLPAVNPSGSGWAYCWSQQYNTAPSYTIQAAAIDCTTGTLDSTNRINNTNYFYPSNNLSGLIGCPLNGTWNVEICDDWAIDNGYIFSVDLNFSATILHQSWSYNVLIDTVQWSGPYIYNWTDSSVTIRTPDSISAGFYSYNFSIIDEYGCNYDSLLSVEIISRLYVNLGADKDICDGSVIILDAGGPCTNYSWSNGDTSQSTTVSVEGYYYVRADNSNGIVTCSNYDTVYVTVHPTPVTDFTADTTNGYAPLVAHFINTTLPDIPYTFQWDFGDGTGSSLEDPSHDYLTDGSFTVTLRATSQYGCTDLETKADYIQVLNNFSVNTIEETFLKIYPNPVCDEFIIENNSYKGKTSYEILNPVGRVVLTGCFFEKTTVQVKDFAAGVYLIKLKNVSSYELKQIVKE